MEELNIEERFGVDRYMFIPVGGSFDTGGFVGILTTRTRPYRMGLERFYTHDETTDGSNHMGVKHV